MQRYRNMEVALRRFGEKNGTLRFMEIGTDDGVLACRLLNGWLRDNSRRRVWYYGFDEFLRHSLTEVHGRMIDALPWTAHVSLYKGVSEEVLTEVQARLYVMDFLLWRGGSPESYQHAWSQVCKLMYDGTQLFVDDYCPTCNDIGSGHLIRTIQQMPEYQVTVLDPMETHSSGLDIHLVRVQYRKADYVDPDCAA